MGVIDLLIIVAIIVGCIWGAMKGAIKQLASMAAIVLGILVARIFGQDVAEMYIDFMPELADSENSKWVASILGHVTVFVFIYLTISIIGMFTKSLLRSLKLGIFDKIGGAVFCAFKFLLGLSLILNMWLVLDPGNSAFRGSKMMGGKPFEITMGLAPWLLDTVENECTEVMQKVESEMSSAEK